MPTLTRSTWLALALGLASLLDGTGLRADDAPAEGTPKPEGTLARSSYAMGREFGENFRNQFIEIDLQALYQGIADGLKNNPSPLSAEEAQAALKELSALLQQQYTARRQKLAEANKRAGADFLLDNGKQEGVVILASGLQYKVVRVGKGEKPAITDRVALHYRGTLLDGTEFDSSYKRGEPQHLNVATAIRAWNEALPLMSSGSKWILYVPPELAYGEKGSGEKIPPNATLVFEIELLGID
ncbi:MAG: FKBP-type peptidyl-prolyl cis-trans isomerase [Pirellulales bacterium]|nr:FKBP-type peptidyl-prolyl cis-trans isomerase [Pirellulales bacterium]